MLRIFILIVCEKVEEDHAFHRIANHNFVILFISPQFIRL